MEVRLGRPADVRMNLSTGRTLTRNWRQSWTASRPRASSTGGVSGVVSCLDPSSPCHDHLCDLFGDLAAADEETPAGALARHGPVPVLWDPWAANRAAVRSPSNTLAGKVGGMACMGEDSFVHRPADGEA